MKPLAFRLGVVHVADVKRLTFAPVSPMVIRHESAKDCDTRPRHATARHMEKMLGQNTAWREVRLRLAPRHCRGRNIHCAATDFSSKTCLHRNEQNKPGHRRRS